MAQEFWLSAQTIKYHLTNIYRKLGVGSRTEAVHQAYEHGLIENPVLRMPAVCLSGAPGQPSGHRLTATSPCSPAHARTKKRSSHNASSALSRLLGGPRDRRGS